MIQKYTKKPVTIEAVQLNTNYDSIVECVEFVFNIGMDSSMIGEAATVKKVQEEGGFLIPTLEGDMKASFGDFIIKGVKGEFYPCKPDIFYATYDGPTRVLWDHTTGEYDKEWLPPRAFKKESGEYIPNGYGTYIKEKEVEKISEDEARIREILKDPSSVFVGYSQEGYNLHIWINQGKKYYIEPELNRINRIEY